MRTELHRHLDASFRASTLAELTKQFGVPAPFSNAAEVATKFWLTSQMGNLKEVLDCFVLFQKLLRNVEILERIGREVVEDAKNEGTDQVELRYSPTFTSEFSQIPWQDGLDAFLRGMREGERLTGVRAGLICIVSRGYPLDDARATIEFAVSNRKNFIGVDLAGPEEGYPCRMYQDVFKPALAARLPITIHAGEACGPENVWEAIDLLGATRIGHGINSIRDKELMARLARDQILLETCPTSNYITRSIEKWSEHPLPRFLDAGIPVSISTDDPGIFGVPLGEEYARCKKFLAMSDADLRKVDEYAATHSFLDK